MGLVYEEQQTGVMIKPPMTLDSRRNVGQQQTPTQRRPPNQGGRIIESEPVYTRAVGDAE